MSTYCTATVINHKEIVPGVWKMELAAPKIAKRQDRAIYSVISTR